MSKASTRAAMLAAALISFVLAGALPARAAEGDLYEAGTLYRATTYSGHSNYHLWPAVAQEFIVDITVAQSAAGEEVDNAGNFRFPVRAPGDGTVEQVSEGYGGGWGNSIVWTSADGREEIHVAHLEEVVATGPVSAGEVIGLEGSTGLSVPSDFNHLHVSRRLDGAPAPVVLSGVTLEPGSHRAARGGQRLYEATEPLVVEQAGPGPFDHAAEAARLGYPAGADTVILASVDDAAEALSMGALGGVYEAPVLLAGAGGLPPRTYAELRRLGPVRVVTVGLEGRTRSAVRRALPAAEVLPLATPAGASRGPRV